MLCVGRAVPAKVRAVRLSRLADWQCCNIIASQSPRRVCKQASTLVTAFCPQDPCRTHPLQLLALSTHRPPLTDPSYTHVCHKSPPCTHPLRLLPQDADIKAGARHGELAQARLHAHPQLPGSRAAPPAELQRVRQQLQPQRRQLLLPLLLQGMNGAQVSATPLWHATPRLSRHRAGVKGARALACLLSDSRSGIHTSPHIIEPCLLPYNAANTADRHRRPHTRTCDPSISRAAPPRPPQLPAAPLGPAAPHLVHPHKPLDLRRGSSAQQVRVVAQPHATRLLDLPLLCSSCLASAWRQLRYDAVNELCIWTMTSTQCASLASTSPTSCRRSLIASRSSALKVAAACGARGAGRELRFEQCIGS